MQSRSSTISRQYAFTLVELLVVIAIIAVLLAVLVPSLRNARGLGQRTICKSRLKNIGTSVYVYSEQHDGLMPRGDINERWKSEYWAVAQRHNLGQPTQYYGLGCLWKAGLVSDGRFFYCLAVRGWYDEYKNYCDPTPWGTLPQNYNVTTYPTHMQHIRAYKGYLFWPQTRELLTAAELATFPMTFSAYTAGYPYSPYLYSDMGPGRAMSLDCSPHTVKGSGFNANVLFGDGHVSQHLWAQDEATGKYFFPAPLDNYGCDVIPNLDPPYNDAGLWWNVISVCQYTAKYQP